MNQTMKDIFQHVSYIDQIEIIGMTFLCKQCKQICQADDLLVSDAVAGSE